MRTTPTDSRQPRRHRRSLAAAHMIYLSIGTALAIGAVMYLPWVATHGWLSKPTLLEFWLEFAMPAAIYLAIGAGLWVRWLRSR